MVILVYDIAGSSAALGRPVVVSPSALLVLVHTRAGGGLHGGFWVHGRFDGWATSAPSDPNVRALRINFVAAFPGIPSPPQKAMFTFKAFWKHDAHRWWGATVPQPHPLCDWVVVHAILHCIVLVLVREVAAVHVQAVQARIRANAELVPATVWCHPCKINIDGSPGRVRRHHLAIVGARPVVIVGVAPSARSLGLP